LGLVANNGVVTHKELWLPDWMASSSIIFYTMLTLLTSAQFWLFESTTHINQSTAVKSPFSGVYNFKLIYDTWCMQSMSRIHHSNAPSWSYASWSSYPIGWMFTKVYELTGSQLRLISPVMLSLWVGKRLRLQ
jgi:hypothetical protein